MVGVLPEPLAPTNPVIRPGTTSNETSWRTWWSPKERLMPRNEIMTTTVGPPPRPADRPRVGKTSPPREGAAPPGQGSAGRRDDAVLVGPDHRVDPVPHAQLHQHVRDVRLDRRLAEEQLGGHLRVGGTPREQQ